MGLHPTTHAAYPKMETEEQRRAGEIHSLTACLRQHGFVAGVSEQQDGSLNIVVLQCLNEACTDVKATVLRVMRAADPDRSRAGRISVSFGGKMHHP